MRHRLALVLLFSFIGSTLLNGAEAPSPALLVLAKTDHTLATVDPVTLKVVGRVPSGPDPHEVIASADGTVAYISNYGGGAYNTITPVDLLHEKHCQLSIWGRFEVPMASHSWEGSSGLPLKDRQGSRHYDPAISKVDWVLGTGQDRTHMIFVAADLKQIFTSNVSWGTVTLIEKGGGRGQGFGSRPNAGGPGGPPPGMQNRPGGRTGPPQANWEETVVSVGRGAEGFDVSPDGKEIWAANAQDGTISIIDIAGKRLIRLLTQMLKAPTALKFTPDGKLVFVSSLGGPDVAVLEAPSRKEVKRVNVGHGAAGILMQPDGLRVYVALHAR